MLFTPVLALIGLAAAAPQGLATRDDALPKAVEVTGFAVTALGKDGKVTEVHRVDFLIDETIKCGADQPFKISQTAVFNCEDTTYAFTLKLDDSSMLKYGLTLYNGFDTKRFSSTQDIPTHHQLGGSLGPDVENIQIVQDKGKVVNFDFTPTV